MILRFLGRRKEAVLPPDTRVYAIGDIHGRLDLFTAILHMIEEDNASRSAADVQVILLGDLIDRGPDSAGVVARAMQPLGFASLRAILGNHEAAMLGALDGDRAMLRTWLRYGGRETLASWGLPPESIDASPAETAIGRIRATIPREQLAWLGRLPLSLSIGDYYFVHAGVRPGIALDRQSEEDCLWIRETFLESRSDHGAVVVHGHSPTAEAEMLPNRIGIDTGAYATGRLTALGLEGGQRWLLEASSEGRDSPRQCIGFNEGFSFPESSRLQGVAD